MAKLQTHSNYESVINPDDKQLSKEYNEARVQQVADAAMHRINEFSQGRNERDNGGLEGFFDGLEGKSFLNASALARKIQNRVLKIIQDGSEELAMSPHNGASSAILDQQLWRYAREGTYNKILNVRANTLSSLTVLKEYKEMIAKAQAGATEQLEIFKNAQAEARGKRSWWRKTGSTIAKFATFGIYNKERLQDNAHSRLSRKLQERFSVINANVKQAEREAENRKNRMRKHLEKVMSSTHNPAEKSQLKKELITAIQNTSGDLSEIDLSSWRNYAGGLGITEDQEKIDFLEAAKELDFVKNDLAAIGISKEKNMRQSEMIESAKFQQEVMTNSKNFKAFEEIKDKSEFKGLTPNSKNALETKDLVELLEKKLQGNGIDVEKEVYESTDNNIKKSDLLVPSTKLVLLIRAIADNKKDSLKAINKSAKAKQAIIDWIAKRNLTSSNKEEISDPEKTKEFLETLIKKEDNSGILVELSKLVEISRDLESADLEVLKKSISKISSDISTKKAEFETFKDLNVLTKHDYRIISELWTKAVKTRDFLETNIDKWLKTKDKNSKLEQGKEGYLDALNKQIDALLTDGRDKKQSISHWRNKLSEQLNKQELSESQKEIKGKIEKEIDDLKISLKKAEEARDSLISSKNYKSKDLRTIQSSILDISTKIEAKERSLADIAGLSSKHTEMIRAELKDRENKLEELLKKRDEFIKQENLHFESTDDLIKIKNELAEAIGTEHELKLSSKVVGTISLAERLQDELATEDFSDEIDKKFLQELARNDQYELLKTVSVGTSVELTYKPIGGSSNLSFPNQLNGTKEDNFIVFRKTDKAIHLRNDETGKVITILSPAADKDGNTAYKNAIVRNLSDGEDTIINPRVGGAGEHSIVYNVKIIA